MRDGAATGGSQARRPGHRCDADAVTAGVEQRRCGARRSGPAARVRPPHLPRQRDRSHHRVSEALPAVAVAGHALAPWSVSKRCVPRPTKTAWGSAVRLCSRWPPYCEAEGPLCLRRRLIAIAEATGADELMLSTPIYDPGRRVHSLDPFQSFCGRLSSPSPLRTTSIVVFGRRVLRGRCNTCESVIRSRSADHRSQMRSRSTNT